MERVMEYILAIAKFKSVSKAAENLFISQPALSAIVKKEEKRLGVELFDRQYKPLICVHYTCLHASALVPACLHVKCKLCGATTGLWTL